MIFDTHAHYDDRAFDDDRDELLKTINAQGITNIVNVASGMPSCISSMELSDKYDFIYAAVGVHPSETQGLTDADMDLLEKYCDHKKVVAIGEIGLDYHYDEPAVEIQKEFFEKQLAIAAKMNMPIIIHSRDAAKDTMDIMKAYRDKLHGGVIHCYSYSADMAKEYVDMGYYIGIGGVITFKNARKLVEVVETIPISSIVLETDCPYLAPEPYRGKRNHSLYLKNVANRIAELKNITPEEVITITEENAYKLYQL